MARTRLSKLHSDQRCWATRHVGYAQLEFAPASAENAMGRLSAFPEADLKTWRQRAAAAGVPVALLYQLLYQQRLPLLYRPLQLTELELCRD